MAKARRTSRPARWADAAGKLLAALEKMEECLDAIETAEGDLRGVQEEYEEWKDNQPENLSSSALGEKLEAVCDLFDRWYNARAEGRDRGGEVGGRGGRRGRPTTRVWKGLTE